MEVTQTTHMIVYKNSIKAVTYSVQIDSEIMYKNYLNIENDYNLWQLQKKLSSSIKDIKIPGTYMY